MYARNDQLKREVRLLKAYTPETRWGKIVLVTLSAVFYLASYMRRVRFVPDLELESLWNIFPLLIAVPLLYVGGALCLLIFSPFLVVVAAIYFRSVCSSNLLAN